MVIQNILRRADELRKLRSSNSLTKDSSSLKTGLWLAGGWQNAIFGAGFLCHLEDHDYSSAFDAMGGTTASIWNAAFFQARQMEMCESIYLEENCRKGFIDYRFSRRIINLQLLEDVVRYEKVLKIERIRRNPCPLVASVTNINGVGELIDVKSGGYDIIDALVASTIPPTKENRPRMLKGKPYVTGILSIPLPLLNFSSLFGLTDLLVVLNEPNVPRQKNGWIKEKAEEFLASLFIRPLTPGLIKAFLTRNDSYNKNLIMANSGELDNGCRVQIIAPARKNRISKLSTNPDELRNLSSVGRRIANEVLRSTY